MSLFIHFLLLVDLLIFIFGLVNFFRQDRCVLLKKFRLEAVALRNEI